MLAVDESPRFIETVVRQAQQRGFTHLEGRVEQVESLRLEPGSLDGAFARWLFCFLPDPAPVIEKVVSGLRPAGRFVIWDYLNYHATKLYPPSPAFERVLAAVRESWRRAGGDLNVGGRLPGLLAGAGCRVLDLVPIVRLARPGTGFWEWPTGFFLGFVPRLVEAGLLTEAERRAFEAEWQQREQDPGAFLCPPSMVGIIAEKRQPP